MSYTTDYIMSLHGDPVWEAIWKAIKGWDLRREGAAGYAGASGDDATSIYEAVKRSTAPNATKPFVVMIRQPGEHGPEWRDWSEHDTEEEGAVEIRRNVTGKHVAAWAWCGPRRHAELLRAVDEAGRAGLLPGEDLSDRVHELEAALAEAFTHDVRSYGPFTRSMRLRFAALISPEACTLCPSVTGGVCLYHDTPEPVER